VDPQLREPGPIILMDGEERRGKVFTAYLKKKKKRRDRVTLERAAIAPRHPS